MGIIRRGRGPLWNIRSMIPYIAHCITCDALHCLGLLLRVTNALPNHKWCIIGHGRGKVLLLLSRNPDRMPLKHKTILFSFLPISPFPTAASTHAGLRKQLYLEVRSTVLPFSTTHLLVFFF
jgi:hypothetical protein